MLDYNLLFETVLIVAVWSILLGVGAYICERIFGR